MLLQSYFLFPFQTEKLFFSKKFSNLLRLFRSSHRRCSVRKGVLRNFAIFTGKHLYQSLFFNTELYYIKKETLAQVFSYEFCEISKNTFFNRTPLGDCFYLLFAVTKICVFNDGQITRGEKSSWGDHCRMGLHCFRKHVLSTIFHGDRKEV